MPGPTEVAGAPVLRVARARSSERVSRRVPALVPLLWATYNESTIAADYPSTTVPGGTVTTSAAQQHEGAQSLRVQRTSAGTVVADVMAPFPVGGALQCCGSFWLYVASLPTGVGNTPIFEAWHTSGDNLEITLSNSGQVKVRRQNTALVSGAESAASATALSTGTWYQVRWTHDGSTGTLFGSVAVNGDTPVTTSWAQTAEGPDRYRYGCQFAIASLVDLHYDEQLVYRGLELPPWPVAGATYPQALDATGSAGPVLALQPGPVLQPSGAGSLALGRAVSFTRSVNGGSAPAAVKRPGTVRSLSAASAPALQKRPGPLLQAAGASSSSIVPLLVRGIALAASGAVSALFARSPALVKATRTTGGGNPALSRSPARPLQLTGSATPSALKRPGKVVQASGAGTPSVLLGMLRTWLLSATGGGLPSFVRDVRMVKQRAGLTAPVFVKRAARPVSVPASALAALVRQPAGRLQVVCGGVAVVAKRPGKALAATAGGVTALAGVKARQLVVFGSATVQIFTTAILPPILDFFSGSVARGNSASSSPDVTEMGATDPGPQVLSGPDLRDFDPPNPGAAP